jgi:hypothetical protein
MEVALGIDELNWFGRTIEKEVMPIRSLLLQHCVTDYSPGFRFVDFVLHVGEQNKWGSTVKLQKRAASIGCHLFLDIPIDPPSKFVTQSIVSELKRGAADIVSFMEQKGIEFNSGAFLRELESVTTAATRT